ncbi:MAG: phosphomannomutase, partial [Nitrospirales bacterium]|nr:phosphomannomutase [Nitrospirales bacterium]
MDSSMVNDAIFRQYDIRGIVGKDLDRDVALQIGKAYGTALKELNPSATTVSIGRDVRNSSAELASGLTEGITSTGLDVIDLGECPTPLQYYSLFLLNLDGGIMVTGSHNPPEYNGFKISIGKETIHGEEIQSLHRLIQKGTYHTAKSSGSV